MESKINHPNHHGYALTFVGGHSVHPSKHPPTANTPSVRHPERSEVLLREPCAFERTITISRSDPMQNLHNVQGSTKETL